MQEQLLVFGPIDTREIVVDPFPYIKLLKFNINGTTYRGTAFFIAPKILLTAAHNLYNRQLNTYFQDFQFLKLYGNQQELNIKKVYVPEEYKNASQNQKFRYDFGVIQVKEGVENFMIVDWGSNGNFQDVNVVGYPGVIYPNGEGTQGISANNMMYTANGRCQRDGDHLIRYTLPTSGGQSGCPVFYRDNNNSFVIGVHTLGDSIDRRNIGVLLTKQIREIINQWIEPNQI